MRKERGKQANEASFWSHQGFDIHQLASISIASVWVPEGEKKNSKERVISRGTEQSAGSLCFHCLWSAWMQLKEDQAQ